MADPLAILGATTGTLGFAIAARREYYANRTRVAVEHGINLNMSREQPGEMLGAWLLVRVRNRGGGP